MKRWIRLLLICVLFFCALGVQSSSAVSLRWVVSHCSSRNGWCGWQRTVMCENSGRWYDTPGFFMFGLQFHPTTLYAAERRTGVRATAWPPSQIVNAIWVRNHSRIDPWPNCPNP